VGPKGKESQGRSGEMLSLSISLSAQWWTADSNNGIRISKSGEEYTESSIKKKCSMKRTCSYFIHFCECACVCACICVRVYVCVCVCVCVCKGTLLCHGRHVEVREVVGMCCLLPPCPSLGSNTGYQAGGTSMTEIPHPPV